MRRLVSRLPAHLLGFVLGSLSLSTGVAAQSKNRALVDSLESQLLAVATALSLAVLATLVYTVLRFRDPDESSSAGGRRVGRGRGRGSGPKSEAGAESRSDSELGSESRSGSGSEAGSGSGAGPSPDSDSGPGPGPALEITWTVAAAIVLLLVGVASYSVLASPYVSPDQSAEIADGTEADGLEALDAGDDTEVHVQASQWDWNASYPETETTTRNEIVIPADENVTIWLTSDDVVHSLFVPDLGIKQDAIPGQYTRVRTVAYEPGEYDVRCTEFCGTGHAGMTGSVVVLESDAYEAWLSAQNGESRDGQGGRERAPNATAFLDSASDE